MNYTGMTVNERLVVSGLDKKFDKAIENKDVDTVVKILEKVNLDKRSIEDILKKYSMR